MFGNRQLGGCRLQGICLGTFSRHPTDALATSPAPSRILGFNPSSLLWFNAHPGLVLIGFHFT